MDLTFKTSEGCFNYRVAGIIIHEQRLLIMRNDQGKHYYLPGGRVSLHESSEEAIVREIKEELQVDARVVRLLWIHENFFEKLDSKEKFHEICLYYLMDVPSEFLSQSNQQFSLKENNEMLFHFDWMPLTKLHEVNLKPECIKRIIQSLPYSIEQIISKES